jgi:hypothetical protein|tara:strand:+ start:698 stop:1897 length:1200 start_codon:yes stop_codon:yes gene_type:complete
VYDILIVSLPEMDKDKPAPALGFLKSYIEQNGFSVKTIDGNQIEDVDLIHLAISQFPAKYIGISVFSYEQKDIALEIGSEYNNVLYGGSGVQCDWPHGDYIVGEGEYALLEYLKGNKDYPGINGKPPQQIDNLNDLPPPDYTEIHNEHNYESAVISGSRGCVRDCTFCDVASIWPKYRWWDGKTLAENMHKLADQGFKRISFSDSLVNGSMKHFRTLCYELSKRERKIKWNGQFIIRNKRSFDDNDFDNLANSGCTGLTLGIESGSESVRNHMKKKFSNDDLDYFIHNLGKRNIKMKFLLIAGYPTETTDDFKQTIDMLYKFKKYSNITEVSPHMMLIDKNTPLDYNHRDLYDDYGFHWISNTSDYGIRYERFKEIFKVGHSCGYGFKKHALDKIEKFA